jgi:formylglycine-generating enzyme required for sulfatase activity
MADLISLEADGPSVPCNMDEAQRSYARRILHRGLDLALTLSSGPFVSKRNQGPLAFSHFENKLGMRFLFVPAGCFMMGSPPPEPDLKAHEQIHGVTLTKGFFLQTAPVTVDQWRVFSEETGYRSEAETNGSLIWNDRGVVLKEGYHWRNPGFDQSGASPVTCITYRDATRFINWLRKADGRLYDLPTEAQWEYACRAGSSSRYFFGNEEERLNEYAWFWGNADRRTHPVAMKQPNAWGFYDMLGNVWELCRDHCGLKHGPHGATILSDTYGKGNFTDPVSLKGPFRICRGGDWACLPTNCRPAKRMACSPRSGANIRGLRLAIHASDKETRDFLRTHSKKTA